MTWPSPHPPTLPPPQVERSPVRTDPEPSEQDVESPAQRRRRSAVPAAAWLALLGGALVLLASAIVVVSRWDAIGRGFRVAGLLVGTGGLIVASERLRRVVPTTASIIAHVGTFLAAPIGIAGMSLVGATWPACLLAGGTLAAVVSEAQARRWQPGWLRSGQVVAISLAATGLAATTDTTGGMVAAIAAAGLLVAGAHRRAAALSIVAVVSPSLTALADAGIGAGTFARAGLVGDDLGWSGPIVGVLAAMILGVASRRRRDEALMVAAWAAPVIGTVTGLSAIGGSPTAWLCVPGLVVIAAELCWWTLPGDRPVSPIRAGLDLVAGGLAATAVLAPWLVREVGLGASAPDHPWAIPVAVAGSALALATYRWRVHDLPLVDLGIAGTLATGIGTLWALDAPPVLSASAGLVAVALGAFLSRRIHPAAVYVPAIWTAVSIIDITPGWGGVHGVVATVLVAGLVGVVAAVRARLARTWIGWVEMSLVIGGAATLTTELVTSRSATAAMVGGAVAALAVAAADRRFLPLALAADGAIALVALDAASRSGSLDPTYWIGWAAIAATAGVLWATTRSPLASHAVAAAAVFSAASSMATVTITAEEFIGLAMVTVAALTGVAAALQRRSPLDASAVAAGVVLLSTTTFDVDAGWVSASWLVIGLAMLADGVLLRQAAVQLIGAATATIAAGSWWFTSGLHDRFVVLLEPADVTVGDLWMLAATGAAFAAGAAARRTLTVSSWLAYAAALSIAGIWLTSVQLERETVWAVPLALTISVVAAAVGAWRRLAALLVGGTAMTAVTVFVASGSDLRAIPTWSWLAVGGLALLGVAVLIERTGEQGGAGLRELVDRWD